MKKIVAVSGGFDILHAGHINLLREARKLGDKLIVILNNDNWLAKKKNYVFMNEHDRMKIMKAIRYVDEVVLTCHAENDPDVSVCRELEKIRPDIFANGGDRNQDNIPEYQLCNSLGIQMVFNVGGGKVASSSQIAKKHSI